MFTLPPKRPSPLVYAVLLLALLAQAVIPAGFMPGKNAQAHMTMVICTGDGAKTVPMPAAFDPTGSSHEKQSKRDHSCPYAPVVTPYDLAAPALLPDAPAVTKTARAWAEPAIVGRSDTKSWRAQAPPASLI